eukprot:scaffold29189_cov34-Phaeocystis_antarctica.AAC.1
MQANPACGLQSLGLDFTNVGPLGAALTLTLTLTLTLPLPLPLTLTLTLTPTRRGAPRGLPLQPPLPATRAAPRRLPAGAGRCGEPLNPIP